MRISHYPRWIRKLFIKTHSLPEQITFFITNKCNLKCQHCFFWKELNKPTKELTLEEIEKFSKTMGKFAFLSLTGGEPFLRKNISEIATIFCKNNGVLRLSIPTNGVLSEEIVRSTKRILEKNKSLDLIVKISLDGLGEDHDKVRRMEGCFERAIATYRKLEKLKKVHRNLKLGVLITVFSLNQDKVDELYDFIRSELKPDHVGLNLIRGNLQDDRIKEIDFGNYKKLYKRILDDFPKTFFHLYKEKVFEFLTKVIEENRFQTDCFAGTLSAVIYENGDVFPCEPLDKKIGNLRDFNYDFEKLWSSKRAQEIRDSIRNSRCFCHHECNLPINVLFNPKLYPGLLKDLMRGGEK